MRYCQKKINMLTLMRFHININYVNVYYNSNKPLIEEDFNNERQKEMERCISSSSYPF